MRIWLAPLLVLAGCWLGPAERESFYDRDGDGISWPDDCDDQDDAVGIATGWYRDADGDGFGGADPLFGCTAPEGYAPVDGDCNDTRPTVHPESIEFCNGLDDDCDALTDRDDPDADDAITWYLDHDGDEHGNIEVTLNGCEQPFGFVLASDDCDDRNERVHPLHPEICDEIDNDCDELVDRDDDDIADDTIWYSDADGDGWGGPTTLVQCEPPGEDWVVKGGDCDDAQRSVYPLARESCNNVDDDCDGFLDLDDPDASGRLPWYEDGDGDGYGDPTVRSESCGQPEGYVANNGDCDDDATDVNGGADEVCNDLDDDCDTLVDWAALDATWWYVDADDDGYGHPDDPIDDCDPVSGRVPNGDDCDDADPEATPDTIWYVDGDGDGYGDTAVSGCERPTDGILVGGDCDDADDTVNPDTVWYADADLDGFGDASAPSIGCEALGGVRDATDCDDADPYTNPDADELCGGLDEDCDGTVDEPDAADATGWYEDLDRDGYGDATGTPTPACERPADATADASDCDDADALVYPGSPELCDGLDNDCDTTVDNDIVYVDWYLDDDGDGYGDPASTPVSDCAVVSGRATNGADCDDADTDENPVAIEVCDGDDDDCDSEIDEGLTSPWYRDADSDGYGVASGVLAACTAPTGYTATTGDCDDGDDTAHPGAVEVCDGVDDDCDGDADEGALIAWHADADSDGYGDAAAWVTACTAPSGSVADGSDCDDSDPAVKPGAIEACNDIDDDCDGTIDPSGSTGSTTWYADADADGYGDSGTSVVSCDAPSGYVAASTDCDDADPAVRPGAPEQCNAADDDCDGTVDDSIIYSTWYTDADGDGFGKSGSSGTVDCVAPTATIDNALDCDDADASVNPAATEACNAADDDCDGTVDDGITSTWYRDADKDGFGALATPTTACAAPSGYVADSTDCADADATAFPGAAEACDGADDDCDGLVDDGVKTLFYRDADSDGAGDPTTTTSACAAPSGYVATGTDCADSDGTAYPGATETCDGADDDCDGTIDEGVKLTFYRDADSDGYGASASTTSACTAPSGYVAVAGDCNDAAGGVHPGAAEVCNTVDDDCNGTIDPSTSVGAATWYVDADGDGFGAATGSTKSCAAPSGYVSLGTDCNDGAATVRPGAPEQCNSVDDDCDGTVDDGITYATWYDDDDGDGFGDSADSGVTDCTAPSGTVDNKTDCDDADATVNPGEIETCDLEDDDCDGTIDDGVKTTFYRDADGDGYGTASTTSPACTAPSGYVASSADCDDTLASVKPGAVESCNSRDDDCDGSTDEGVTTTWYRDADGDGYGTITLTSAACSAPSGYVANSTDCDDSKSGVSPVATETCDAEDDDCDGTIDDGVKTTWYRDADGDGYGTTATTTAACTAPSGYVAVSTDCNDASATVYPSAAETCNGVDDDCDATIDDGVKSTFYRDADGDTYGTTTTTTTACSAPTGYVASSTDCNDGNASVNPGATEACNLIDDDCDSTVDEGVKTTFYRDADSDGYGTTATTSAACTAPSGYVANSADCNDGSATIKPGGTETCNSTDDDCDTIVDEGVKTTFYRDADGDSYGTSATTSDACSAPSGYVANSTDCNDASGAVHPGATESCNAVDDDCDSTVDEGVKLTFYRDADSDGYGTSGTTTTDCTAPSGFVASSTDCDDGTATTNPGASESCNLVDDDCDSTVDEGVKTTFYRDADGDGYGTSATTSSACTAPSGYVASSTDCNDGAATIRPGAPEQCNSIDDDCDGTADDGITYSNWYTDADGDGYGAISASPVYDCSAPSGTVDNNTDCDDGKSGVSPGGTETCDGEDDDCDGTVDDGVKTTFYRDADGDTYGTTATTSAACTAPSGYVANNTDCNDSSSAVKPGATETCNSIDDDCDSLTDEGVKTTFYRDADGDGYGVSSPTSDACTAPSGYVANTTDCNDASAAIKPGATETCNGVDDDCDSSIDESVKTTYYRDADVDGYGTSATTTDACSAPSGYVASSTDCNDSSAAVNPGATETCNAVDDDCDSTVDEGVKTTYYRDADGDTYGTSATTSLACSAPSGYVANSTDCNDSSAAIKPGATESCNGVDDDCDSTIDEGVKTTYYRDADIDTYGNLGVTSAACSAPSGYVANSTDCDDTDNGVYPGATEICDLEDDDCDGSIDEGTTTTFYRDADGDTYGTTATTTAACSAPTGYVANSTDCNDSSAAIKPGATETCNGVDDDCDATIDEGVKTTYYRDADGDTYGTTSPTSDACSAPSGYVANTLDCNDSSAAIKPGATETCNGIDDDCDTAVDEGATITYYRDADGDGYGNIAITSAACSAPSGYVANSTDCNDSSAAIKPGATEACNGIDDDCDGEIDEGGTRRVPADHPTITAAISAACDGDTVEVSTGTYDEDVAFGGKRVSLVAVDGPWTAVIKGHVSMGPGTLDGFEIDGASDGAGTCLTIVGTEAATPATVLDVYVHDCSATSGGCIAITGVNVSLTGVEASACSASADGGGIFVDFVTGVVLDTVTVTDSTANQGGGIAIRNAENTWLYDVDVSGNEAISGGAGVLVDVSPDVTIDGGSISDNGLVTTPAWGGGVYLTNNSYVLLNAVTIASNRAQSGGGVSSGANGGAITLQGVTLQDNVATANGGGAYSGSDNDFRLTASVVQGNTALGDGGGLYYEGSGGSVTSTDLYLNSAKRGGAAYAYLYSGYSMTFHEVSVVGNTATTGGAGAVEATALPGSSFDLVASEFEANAATYGFYGFSNLSVVATRFVSEQTGLLLGGQYATARNVTVVDSALAGIATQGMLAGDATITNCIVYDGGQGVMNLAPGNDPLVTYTDVFGNGVDYVGMPNQTGILGNTSVNPDFLSYSTALTSDYWLLQLAPTSPLINAGDPTTFDVNGTIADPGYCGGIEAIACSLYYTDSDADGLYDGWETQFYGSLLHNGGGDTDGDAFMNSQEFAAGTRPNQMDTDGDGHPDGPESLGGWDPLDPLSHP